MKNGATNQVILRQILLFYAGLLVFLCAAIPIAGYLALSIAASNLTTSVSNNLILGNHRNAVISLKPFSARYFRQIEYLGLEGGRVFAISDNSDKFPEQSQKTSIGTVEIREAIQLPDSVAKMGVLVYRYNGFVHLAYGILLWALFSAVSAPLAMRLKKSMLRQLDKEKEAQKNAAIASTTQMIAHDVRKPFSLIKATLGTLNQVKTIEQVQAFVASANPTINQSIRSVSSLLEDIMEIDRKIAPDLKPEDLGSLLLRAKADIQRIGPKTDAPIEEEFRHNSLALVDADKILRVFTNIIGNAVEAVHGAKEGEKPRIWLETRDLVEGGVNYTLVTIGNTGSHIAPQDIKRLFEAFYSKGKRKGTGLGLAIAQKIVDDHGGRIWAESDPSMTVQFKMILPSDRAK